MGQIMVYRYRPMRLDPTITTSAAMATGSSLLRRRLGAGEEGVNLQNAIENVMICGNWDTLLRISREAG